MRNLDVFDLHLRHVRAHQRELERVKSKEIAEKKELEQLTITFWTVQLSLLEMSADSLGLIFVALQSSGTYQRNKYTKKMEDLKLFTITEKDRQCLATHLALQLCGINA